jgi:TonB family protein
MSRQTTSWVLSLALCILAGEWLSGAQTPQPLPPSDGGVPGPLERSAVAITTDNPLPKRIATALPEYPGAERQSGRRGTITLRVTVDQAGNVVEVRQPINPDMSVLGTADQGYTFEPPLGEPFVLAATTAVRRWRYESPKQAPVSFFVRIAFSPADVSTVVWECENRPPLPDGSSGGTLVAPKIIKQVSPIYPPRALAANVQGTVIVEATVGTDGTVTSARVLRSVPLLDQAALDAVRQWEFTPGMAFIVSVTVNFKLPAETAPGRARGTAPPE